MISDQERIRLIEILFDKLNRRHFEGTIPLPNIRLSRRMTASAGSVQYGRRRHTLTISVPYHDYYGWDSELVSTLKHEMIHLYLERFQGIRGHGKTFAEFCLSIGTERFCKPLPNHKKLLLYRCPKCKTEYRYRKRVKLYCGMCPPKIHPNARRLRLIQSPESPRKPISAGTRQRDTTSADVLVRQLAFPF